MAHKILSLKLLTLFVILNSCLGAVYGIKCYSCAELGDSSESESESDCERKIVNKEMAECGESQTVCVKDSHEIGEANIVLRGCGEVDADERFGGKDLCKSVSEISDYPKKGVEGTVCLCDTDGCNPATKFSPSRFAILFPALFIGHTFV